MVCAGLTFVFAGWVTDHFSSQGGFAMKILLAAIAFAAVGAAKFVVGAAHRSPPPARSRASERGTKTSRDRR
jgi:hypothetical protein